MRNHASFLRAGCGFHKRDTSESLFAVYSLDRSEASAALFVALGGRPVGDHSFSAVRSGVESVMRHTISVLVENKFGALTRIAGLFSGRGFNIDSLNVAPTQDRDTSRMTLVTRGDDSTLEQIIKQLEKLVDVLEVVDFREGESIDRELVMARIGVDSVKRAEVMQMVEIFRAKIVDVNDDSLTVEITGSQGKIGKFLQLMEGFDILEITRTGKIALPRRSH